jgi:hypothetical protein
VPKTVPQNSAVPATAAAVARILLELRMPLILRRLQSRQLVASTLSSERQRQVRP